MKIGETPIYREAYGGGRVHLWNKSLILREFDLILLF